MCACSVLSRCVRLFVARQASLSMGILQARILEWVAMPSSRESSQPWGLNPDLLHCREIPYHLNNQGSPYKKSLLASVGEIYCRAIRWLTKWIRKDMCAC